MKKLIFFILIFASPVFAQPVVGPQASITCPGGAVDIATTDNIQTVVNANPAGTTYCLAAGVHSVTSAVTPKTGDIFIGAFGAILDGTNWTTTDTTQGAFRTNNQDIDTVTIKNLVIRDMPQKGIYAFKDFSNGWTIEYNEISGCLYGVSLPSDTTFAHNYLHHNVGVPNDSVAANRGGGYTGFKSSNIIIEYNEISYNGPEQKLVGNTGTIFRNNWVHHNLSDGIWYDGDNTGSVINDNIVEDNPRNGIFYEISGDALIYNNTVRRSTTGAAIFISTSQDVETYDNILEDNFRGINYFISCDRIGGGSTAFKVLYPSGYDLKTNSSHGNTTKLGSQSASLANLLSSTNCTTTQLAPYIAVATKALTFEENTYYVPNTSSKYWFWGGTYKLFAEWQALTHDTPVGASYLSSSYGSAPAISTPSNLHVSNATTTTLTLAWQDNSDNETGFELDRSADNSSWSNVTTTASTSYQNTGLTSSTTYYYRVRAVNLTNQSAYTSSISATTTSSLPDAPTNLTVASNTDTTVSLTWTDNSSDETGWSVELSYNNSTWYPTIVSAGSASYIYTGLPPGTLCYFRVKAINASGSSAYSSTVSVTTTADNIPGTITLTATGYKTAGVRYASLVWSGQTTSVDIYRNSVKIQSNLAITVSSYTDTIGRLKGRFKYQICPVDIAVYSTDCSNAVIVR